MSSYEQSIIPLSLSLGLLQNSQALLIDFDTGYSVGDLSGQPSGVGVTKWVKNTGPAQIVVAAGEGVGGSQAAYSPAHATGAISSYSFAPSSTDLGGVLDSTSILEFSFALSFDSVLASPDASLPSVGRFYLGSSGPSVLRIDWDNYGRIKLWDGAYVMAKDAMGDTFVATAGTFYTISGVADFSTHKFTWSVNGVEQGEYNFRDLLASPSANITLYSQNNNAATYTPWAIDNISMVVPEPGVVGLLLLAGALLGMRRLVVSKN